MSLRPVPLSVLDLASKPAGGSHADAVAGSIELARAAEGLGYERFWVAEHHGMPAIASSAPAVLIAAIAARTERIRVGSGGVMLPNHAPLVVAEQFGTLRALYGDRIDLGIGRAPGTDTPTALALRRSEAALSAEDFPQNLLDLIGYFEGLNPITAIPGKGDAPQMWLLGSSGFSAQVAGRLGLPFAFAHHFASDNTEAALGMYRQAFTPSPALEAPHTAIAVQVIADDDPAVVEAQRRPGLISFIRMRQGKPSEPVSVDEGLAYEFSELEQAFIAAREERQAVGSLEHVRSQLSTLLASTRADELIVQASSAQLWHRMRTLELVQGLFAAVAA